MKTFSVIRTKMFRFFLNEKVLVLLAVTFINAEDVITNGKPCNSIVNVYSGCSQSTPATCECQSTPAPCECQSTPAPCECQSTPAPCECQSTPAPCECNQTCKVCEPSKPMDCQDIKASGNTTSGIYTIYPNGTYGIKVRCDMTTAGGGWTVIQRRVNASDFYKGWADYQTGFGDLDVNFWLGNLPIHAITAQGLYELRIDMVGPADEIRYARYDVFAVGDAASKYRLLLGKYSGDAGDSFSDVNGMKFTTKDQDNDGASDGNCAVLYTGAWWYANCHGANLNGDYGNTDYGKGIIWFALTTHYKSLKQVEMKIKRWST